MVLSEKIQSSSFAVVPQRGATASHQMLIRMSPDRVSHLLLIQMPMKPQNQEASYLVLSTILRYDFQFY